MEIKGTLDNKNVSLQDICFQPLSPDNTACAVFSVLQYFQLDENKLDKCITDAYENCSDPLKWGYDAEDWHDQILGCTK